MASEGIRRLCFMVDIEGYSHHPAPEQIDAQYRLRQITEHAFAEARISIDASNRQDQGDGQLVLLPPGLDEPRVIAAMLDGVRDALYVVNRSIEWGRLRLRASISQGLVQHAAAGYVGPAVVLAARLLDSDPLRNALKHGKHCDLAVIVADDLYNDVVAQRHPGLATSGFKRVDVSLPKKNFRAAGWLRTVDRPVSDPGIALPSVSGGLGRAGTTIALVAGGALLGAMGEMAFDEFHTGGLFGDEPHDPGHDDPGHDDPTHHELGYDGSADYPHEDPTHYH